MSCIPILSTGFFLTNPISAYTYGLNTKSFKKSIDHIIPTTVGPIPPYTHPPPSVKTYGIMQPKPDKVTHLKHRPMVPVSDSCLGAIWVAK